MTMPPVTTTRTLPPKGGWRVGSQVQVTRKVAGGQLVQGWEVHFLTGYGVSASVWVPNATHTAAKVRRAIVAKVAQLDQISTLASTAKA